ncbi:MAG: PHP domain-containing protein [Gemmatimonadaceae bacterium]
MSEPVGMGGAHHEFVDLHTHSTASDGARSPAEVVRAAKAARLTAVALTDHDTLAGLADARAAGVEAGIAVIAGVELSAVEGNVETHILGLHLGELSELEHRLVGLREMRLDRAARIVERLNVLGIPVMFEAVLQEAAGGAVGRPHVARALIAGGWVLDFREAFDRYLGNGKAAFVAKDHLPLADAISLIHRAAGPAVLAHPGQQGTRERIGVLAALGLDGVEVLHPSHSGEDSQRLDALAAELDLVRSGGSDWHGAPDGARSLGMMRVPSQWLTDQEARVATRGSRRVA